MTGTCTERLAAFREPLMAGVKEETGIGVFVLKHLLAFFLTGWLAMRLSLPQPSTAMMTVIVLANRQSGMVLAKSFYRVIGTLVGAAMALVILSAFPQQRVLFLLALSLWIGICTAGASLRRNFAAYAFLLAGYTAAIVAVPAIGNPLAGFDSASARVGEVFLAIVVSGVISEVVFPVRLRSALDRAAAEHFRRFIEYVRREPGGTMDRAVLNAVQTRFARDAVLLEDLRSSAIFEDPETRARSRHLQRYNRDFMTALTTFRVLELFAGRLRRGNVAPLQPLLRLYEPLRTALNGPDAVDRDRPGLAARFSGASQTISGQSAALRGVLSNAEERGAFDAGASLMRRFAGDFQAFLDSAVGLDSTARTAAAVDPAPFRRSNDLLSAASAGIRAMLTMVALGAWWIGTAWPSGPASMTIATILCALFATLPDPGSAVRALLAGWLLSIVAATVCMFGVLPLMDGYGLLVAGMAPFMIICFALMGRPSLAMVGMGFGMGFVSAMTLRNPMLYDPARFLNDQIAQVLGVCASGLAFAALPSAIGSRWLRARQLAALRRQVDMAARAPLKDLRHRFESVNHDLISQMTVPGPADGAGGQEVMGLELAVVECGRALIELRRDMAVISLPASVLRNLSTAIRAVSRFFSRPGRDDYPATLAAVNDALHAALLHAAAQPLLEHLHLIRMALTDRDSAIGAFIPPDPQQETALAS